MATAYSPTGHKIIGTRDLIPGTAIVQPDSFSLSGGLLEFAWGGETEVDWDHQHTIRQCGQRVFIAEDGSECLEGDIVLDGSPA